MGQGDSPCPVGCSSWTLNNLQKEREMNIIESKIEIIEADNFSIETKYRMTMKYEGETFYWNGFIGEYGMEATWFDSEGKKTVQPDWADELEESLDKTLFDICEEKTEEDKKKSGRTDCGYEVEQALVKELELQGFPSNLIRQVLATYPIDRIIFDSILKEASIKIDELQKAEVK